MVIVHVVRLVDTTMDPNQPWMITAINVANATQNHDLLLLCAVGSFITNTAVIRNPIVTPNNPVQILNPGFGNIKIGFNQN
jgi:hypothetical protein